MMQIPENPFVLVDGSSYLFRAYHALPPLTTSRGLPTGAIYGVMSMLKKLIQTYNPDNMTIVFDSREKNFRHTLFEPYKANRLSMPEELQQQIEPLFGLIRAMGLPLLVLPGIEADDIIGTLAMEAKKQGFFTLISTSDKDFAQLVDDSITLINTMSQEVLDRAGVFEKFSVPPEKIVDYLTLMGDSIDNIPGIPTVGPKTAVKWLEKYGTLENIIQHASEISGKVGENLRNNLEKLPLFRQLVLIDTTLSLPYHPHDLKIQPSNPEVVQTLLEELEFKRWLQDFKESREQIAHEVDKEENVSGIEYQLLLTEAEFEDWLSHLKTVDQFSFSLELSDLNNKSSKLVGFSFSTCPGKATYIPCGHDAFNCQKQLPTDWLLERLKPVFECKKPFKIGHDLKESILILANQGIQVQGMQYDTMLESYVLDSAGSRHDLNTLSKKYLGYQMIERETIVGRGAKAIQLNEVTIEQAMPYCGEIAEVILRMHSCFSEKLTLCPSLQTVFETIEMPLIPVLARMEQAGVLIDAEQLHKQSQELGACLQKLEKEAFDLSGQSFNLNSPKQLQSILFDRLKLPVLEKTPTGQPSTAESVLQKLSEQFPLPKIVLEYRSLSKLKSTYTDKLPQQIDLKTGRIHTSYHQAVTSTGRLSSSDPNLQNIPIRSEEGRKIRSAFIAAPTCKIVSVDYSQIELRIMAHLSQDPGLIEAFNQDDDIHRSTAANVFGVSLEAVTVDQRRSAKAINFGLLYGMSAFGLARQLAIEHAEAERHMERYFSCFPIVKTFMEQIRQQALERGYVETLFGRRLYLPDLQSRNQALRRAAERAAVNAPMQGSNADIIKLAMIELNLWIREADIPVQMIMQVHDELVFEIAESFVEEAIQKIRRIMENTVNLTVKLCIEVGVGDNWEQAAHLN